jgi:hypothetical protein
MSLSARVYEALHSLPQCRHDIVASTQYFAADVVQILGGWEAYQLHRIREIDVMMFRPFPASLSEREIGSLQNFLLLGALLEVRLLR